VNKEYTIFDDDTYEVIRKGNKKTLHCSKDKHGFEITIIYDSTPEELERSREVIADFFAREIFI
jgi:hypothetical protein